MYMDEKAWYHRNINYSQTGDCNDIPIKISTDSLLYLTSWFSSLYERAKGREEKEEKALILSHS